jgi:hypothetical protein
MSADLTAIAVNWALSMRAHEEEVCAQVQVSDTVAEQVIHTAAGDGVVDAAERVQLSRFAAEAALSPRASAHLRAALALPSERPSDAARRRQLEQAETLARQGLATGSNEGAVLGLGAGLLLGLDALFGGR